MKYFTPFWTDILMQQDNSEHLCLITARRGVSGQWVSYWLDDLHVPHRLVGSDVGPVGELLIARSFGVEAVGKSAQLETVPIWEKKSKGRVG